MNILHFGKFYPPFNGGMEIYLRDLAEQQSQKHNVTALVHNHDFNFIKSNHQEQTINQVKVIRQQTLKPILFTPIMLGVNKVVSHLIDTKNVDVIHISWPNPSALFLLLNKKAKKKPWVIQWQSDMVTEHSSLMLKLAYKFFKPFEKLLLKQASLIIASTKEYFKHSIALKKFEGKCHFVPLALKHISPEVDQNSYQWALKLWGDSNYKVYSIGRLTFYKNHQILIQAAQLLPAAKFIITGSGELENSLKKQINQLGIDNIVLTGGLKKNKLNALLSSCDIFCLPSNDRAESYGMVLLEALTFNKSILVSDLPGSGMKWIASQSPIGMTFKNNNPDDLIEKVKQHSPNPNKNANNKIFQIEHCANTIEALYQNII